MMREALIDLSAIRENVETLRAAARSDAMVIVKANGYGHGAVEAARAALDGGASWLGVVDLTEAMELRAAGITAPVLAWIHDLDSDFAAARDNGIHVGVNYLDQLNRVALVGGGLAVQLKLDTGLGRNGVAQSDWHAVVERAAVLERSGAIRVTGIFSHLANSGPAEDAAQVTRFLAGVADARTAGLNPAVVHLAATAGSLDYPELNLDLVRIGIGAYGISPDGRDLTKIRPAMQVSASIVSVKRVPAGQGVSYGFEHVTTEETTLALVPLGYADGIPRHASGSGQVSINGVRHRVAGRIAMDQFVVDVGDQQVSVGDRAVLFGDDRNGVPTAGDWARAADTIAYEIVTRIGPRVTRRYVR